MNTRIKHHCVIALALCARLSMLAQSSLTTPVGFNSGSNGSFGPLNVTADTTLPLPEDGVIHATTVNIAAGATLRFSKNGRNTPAYLLATGEINIAGTIDASGEMPTPFAGGAGGPGGFSGGQPNGPGSGPGGGKALSPDGGLGAFGSPPTFAGRPETSGAVYGSPLLVPLMGGSGAAGGSSSGGAGGGGAIALISSVSVTIPAGGSVIADGGASPGRFMYFAGSGGGIRLVAPMIGGQGLLSARGGGFSGSSADPTYAGGGRIRVDTLNARQVNFTFRGATPSVGSLMMSMLDPMPRLDITEAGGNVIPLGSGAVTFVLPQSAAGSPIAVKVRAENCGSKVPLKLYATPDNAARATYSATLDNASENPVFHTFSVTVPPNVRVTLHAFAGQDLPPE